jgi:hypothetical protein
MRATRPKSNKKKQLFYNCPLSLAFPTYPFALVALPYVSTRRTAECSRRDRPHRELTFTAETYDLYTRTRARSKGCAEPAVN